MIAASLFSGIGAPEVAMPAWDWRWHAEVEPFQSAVMKARHPASRNLGDVNAPDFVERALACSRPDVLVFGSPCQDFSIAGNRIGMDGDRGNLALVAVHIARALRSRWLVFENVTGLLSSYSGSATTQRALEDRIAADGWLDAGGFADCVEDSDFAALLTALRECGYFGCYRVLDAQFAGVPQRRRRIFFVGYFGDWRPATAVLLEPESLRWSDPPRRTSGERSASEIEAGFDGGNVTGAVSAKWSKGTGGPAGDECYNLVVVAPSVVRRLTPRECERLQGFPDDYTLISYRGRPATDGPRYRALGNAMNVAELRWLLQRIELCSARSRIRDLLF